MELDKAIILSFEYLDKHYNPLWEVNNNTKGSKNKLIEALSQLKVSPAEYLGYKGRTTIGPFFYKAIPELKKIKNKKQLWRNFLLELNNLFLCYSCEKVHTLDKKRLGNSNLCKQCDLLNTQSRRKNLYNYLKNHSCIECGEDNPIVLEFHHLTNKSFNVADISSCSWEKIKKEIEKCEILCANCHRIKTSKQFNWYKYNKGL